MLQWIATINNIVKDSGFVRGGVTQQKTVRFLIFIDFCSNLLLDYLFFVLNHNVFNTLQFVKVVNGTKQLLKYYDVVVLIL